MKKLLLIIFLFSNLAFAQKTPARELNGELLYMILTSEMLVNNNNFQAGADLMANAAKTTNSEEIYQRAVEISKETKDSKQIFKIISDWIKSFPKSLKANYSMMEFLIAENRFAETKKFLQNYLKNTKTEEKIQSYKDLARIYSQVKDKKLVQNLFEEVFQEDLKNPEINFSTFAFLGHWNLVLNEIEKTKIAVEKSYELKPFNEEATLLALELFSQNINDFEDLIIQSLDYLEQNKQNKQNNLEKLRDYYLINLLDKKEFVKAKKQLNFLVKENPKNYQAWLLLAKLNFDNKDFQATKKTLKIFINLVKNLEDSDQKEQLLIEGNLLSAQIAFEEKKYKLSLDYLNKISVQFFEVENLRAKVLVKQGKLNQARMVIKNIPEYEPRIVRFKQAAEVNLFFEVGKNNEAFDLQFSFYLQNPNDDYLTYETALIAERVNKFDLAEDLLRQIIERSPNNFDALNALGYSFVTRGINLKEAQFLLDKALKLAPNNSYILDSVGWLEYKLGNLEKSLELLEKSYKLNPDNEIAIHLAEVLWQLDKKNRALEIFQQVKNKDSENKVLLETLNRLKIDFLK